MIREALISIVIPVYNVEKYILACLESLIHQSYTKIEIILVDDGSNDASPSICDEYALRDSRIKVLHQTNQGLSAARNIGIEYCKGEYIAFVDSDDIVHRDYILHLYNTIGEADIAVCRLKKFTDGEKIQLANSVSCTSRTFNGKEANNNLFHHDLGIHMAVVTNKLFNRTLWENFRFPLGVLHEDIAIIYKILDRVALIQFLDCQLYFYRQRQNSITMLRTFKSLVDEYQALTEQTLFFQDRQQFTASRNANRSRKTLFLLHPFPQNWDVWKDYSILDILKDDLRTETKVKLILKKLSPTLFHKLYK